MYMHIYIISLLSFIFMHMGVNINNAKLFFI